MFCFANVKMRSYWIRVYSKSNDSCLFKKRQHSKIHIQVRWPCDNGDRDRGHGAARKKKAKDCQESPEARKKQGRILPQCLQREYGLEDI